MQRQITTEQVVRAFTDSLKASLYIEMPGTVVAYHAGTMLVDVQPMTNDVRTDLDTDAVVYEPWPVITGIPVAWPRFGAFVCVGPLNVGDPVTLEAFDLDPNPAWAAGKSTSPVNPADVRRLSGNYWKATPTNLTGPIQDVAELAGLLAMLGIDGDTAQVLFALGVLTVGKAGAQVQLAGGGAPVARKGDAIVANLTSALVGGILDSLGHPCTLASGTVPITGTITAGSPLVTSG